MRIAGLLGALVIGAIAQAALGASGAGSDPLARPPVAAPSSAAPSAAAPDGARLFVQNCAGCHGTHGEGRPGAPDIRPAGAALADFVLQTGRMPLSQLGIPMRRGRPAFDEASIQALVTYVAGFADGPAIPQVSTAGASLGRGRELFVNNCAACHGPGGDGGAVGGGIIAPALDQADATTIGEAVVGGPLPMPRFVFAASDLGAVAAYVLYLRTAPRPGGLVLPLSGPVTEGLVAGVALVALLLLSRWIAVRRVE